MTEPTLQSMIAYLEDFIELCGHEDLEDSEMATEHDVKMYRAIADRLRAMQWRPVDTLPEDGDRVLVYAPFGDQPHIWIDEWRMQQECPVSWSSYTVETGMNWCDHDFDDVTHWMPLPPPPEGE